MSQKQEDWSNAITPLNACTIDWRLTGVLLQRPVGNSSRTRIFYGDDTYNAVDNGTDYSGRVDVLSDQLGTQLIIRDVRLSDKMEFFCQVNGLTAGNAEGKTQLRVFGEKEKIPVKFKGPI